MLQNWLQPSPHFADAPTDAYDVWRLGHVARAYTLAEGFPDLRSGGVAIVGLDGLEADRVRTRFYDMARPTEEVHLLDLGNVRTPGGIRNAAVMQELLLAGVTPVFIGRDPDGTLAQYYGYHHAEYLTNLVAIDDRIRFQARDLPTEREYLDHVFDLTPVRLFHLAVLGYQTHYNDPATLDYLHQHHFEFYRLGYAKYEMDECEPILRDADAVALHLSALKYADAPAQDPASTSGFSSEEACQLARFTGMADKVSSFGIYGYHADRDPDAITAETIAQVTWYFVEGFANRKYDFPVSLEGLTQYLIQVEDGTPALKFWKSERSGRWWLEMPFRTAEGRQRHQLIACTYQDYEQAANRQLPDRLIDAYKRFA